MDLERLVYLIVHATHKLIYFSSHIPSMYHHYLTEQEISNVKSLVLKYISEHDDLDLNDPFTGFVIRNHVSTLTGISTASLVVPVNDTIRDYVNDPTSVPSSIDPQSPLVGIPLDPSRVHKRFSCPTPCGLLRSLLNLLTGRF